MKVLKLTPSIIHRTIWLEFKQLWTNRSMFNIDWLQHQSLFCFFVVIFPGFPRVFCSERYYHCKIAKLLAMQQLLFDLLCPYCKAILSHRLCIHTRTISRSLHFAHRLQHTDLIMFHCKMLIDFIFRDSHAFFAHSKWRCGRAEFRLIFFSFVRSILMSHYMITGA